MDPVPSLAATTASPFPSGLQSAQHDVFEQLAWSASRERHFRERGREPWAPEQDGHLPGGGNGLDVRVQAQRPGLGSVHPRREQLERLELPRDAVDDRLTVGRKPRR